MTDIGYFLYDLLDLIENRRGELLCLKELWYLAYIQDQWDVQDIVIKILRNNSIPEEINTQFAEYIIDNEPRPNINFTEELNLNKFNKALKNALIEVSSKS